MLAFIDKCLIIIFVFSSMLSIGTQISLDRLALVYKKKRLWVKLFIANFIIVPFIGISITKIFTLSPDISLAFIALAITPGGINAIQFGSKIPGGAIDAALMMLPLSILAILFSPLLLPYFVPVGIDLSISYGNLFLFFLLFLLAPLFIGILMHYYLSQLAKKIARIFAVLGTMAFITMIILTLGIRQLTLSSHTVDVIIIMLLFIVLTMLTGWLMGGPEKKDRQLFTIITSMRNVAICLAIVMETAPTANVITPLIALSALMVLPNMVLTLIIVTINKIKK